MAALEHGLSSMATGPSGVGKIETFKEITRAVGKKSIVFNCSVSLDYFVLAKFFKVREICEHDIQQRIQQYDSLYFI